eukprot:GHVU01083159.1.p2 GENE.GHVU01083159.1~~GHVU01083159.1.p2  ORF type:complete len:106 (-),score=14.72 GHVU01083159.1:448-765(-)
MIKAKRRICVKLTSNVLLKGNSFCMPLAMFHCCNPGFKQSPQNSLNRYNVSAENVIRKTPIIAAEKEQTGTQRHEQRRFPSSKEANTNGATLAMPRHCIKMTKNT